MPDWSGPAGWLVQHDRQTTPEQMVEGLVAELCKAGVPVWRFGLSLATRHPEVYATTLTWTPDVGCERSLISYTTAENPDGDAYTPMQIVMRQQKTIRCRLDGAVEIPWIALRELAAKGGTDYVIFPLVLGDGSPCIYSLCTRRPGGFSDPELALLEGLKSPLQLRVDAFVQTETLHRLLDVYLGPNAARRVLDGNFRRGTGKLITAAVWYCDLRGFTALADQTPVQEVVALLDQYFEAVAGPVTVHGGEILKFIGDAMLAIFEVGPGGPQDSCRRALSAAEEGLGAVAERFPSSRMRIGVALHYGELLYGNIGARERLDFTVIGRVVNEVCRVEALCKELQVPLLFTRDFRGHLATLSAVPVAHAQLRGVSQAKEIFTLPRYALAP